MKWVTWTFFYQEDIKTSSIIFLVNSACYLLSLQLLFFQSSVPTRSSTSAPPRPHSVTGVPFPSVLPTTPSISTPTPVKPVDPLPISIHNVLQPIKLHSSQPVAPPQPASEPPKPERVIDVKEEYKQELDELLGGLNNERLQHPYVHKPCESLASQLLSLTGRVLFMFCLSLRLSTSKC